jgi:hypothetical protein
LRTHRSTGSPINPAPGELGVRPEVEEEVVTTENWFAAKIAIFNSIGFSLGAASATYVDARLTTNLEYGARHYEAGYPIAIFGGLLILASTFLAIRKVALLKLRIAMPAIVLFIIGSVSLPFFRPGFPHFAITGPVFYYSFTSFLSCFIHLLAFRSDRLAAADFKAALERLKEYGALWRTIAVSVAIGYMAILVPICNTTWAQASASVTNGAQAQLLKTAFSINLCLFSLYVFWGVIYEAFRKANDAADLMLQIRQLQVEAEPGD